MTKGEIEDLEDLKCSLTQIKILLQDDNQIGAAFLLGQASYKIRCMIDSYDTTEEKDESQKDNAEDCKKT